MTQENRIGKYDVVLVLRLPVAVEIEASGGEEAIEKAEAKLQSICEETINVANYREDGTVEDLHFGDGVTVGSHIASLDNLEDGSWSFTVSSIQQRKPKVRRLNMESERC